LRSDPDSPAGRWLAQLFFAHEARALPSAAKKDVLENLIAAAISSNRTYASGRRVARLGDEIYLDLCTPTWEVVKVTACRWTVLPSAASPLRFTRAKAMLTLPYPTRGGRVDELRPFFNCGEDDFRLIVAWTLAALSGGREYPVLVFGGEPGSAKSTATRYARALLDPNEAPLRKCPREERDLFIAANNAYVLTFDNLSTPPEWLSDALCALALDTGYACRALYTDDGERVFRVAAPIILNGISEQLTRSDLADRALNVTLHRIPQEEMKPKDELDAAFEATLPRVLGALLDVLSSALSRLPRVNLKRYPRLAQTAKLMAAAEPGLAWEPGTFARIFDRAQQSVAVNVAEGDPVVQALRELVRRGGGRWTFQDSATSLRAILTNVRPSPIPPGWPPAPNQLTARLRRIAPQLRLMGWEVNPDGRDGTKNNGRIVQLSFPVSTPISKEEGESSESSDRPNPSIGVDLPAGDFEDRTVCDRPPTQFLSDHIEPWTVQTSRSTDTEYASTLAPGRSDDLDDSNDDVFEGEPCTRRCTAPS